MRCNQVWTSSCIWKVMVGCSAQNKVLLQPTLWLSDLYLLVLTVLGDELCILLIILFFTKGAIHGSSNIKYLNFTEMASILQHMFWDDIILQLYPYFCKHRKLAHASVSMFLLIFYKTIIVCWLGGKIEPDKNKC